MKRLSLLIIIVVAVGLAVFSFGAGGPSWRRGSFRDNQSQDWRPLKPKYDDGFMSYLPLQRTWTDSGDNVHDGSGILQPYLMFQDGVYYCFYEYTDAGAFKIGVAYATDLAGTWTDVPDLLEPTGVGGDPDEDDVSDPTVLYIPWSATPWHMWFGMMDDDTGWTIGHATATDNPHIPASWTKQDLDSNSVTDIVIAWETGTKFEGFDSADTHPPEAFIWGGSVHLLYGARDGNVVHTSFDTMLAVANDSHGLGYSFEKFGPVTTDASLAAQDLGAGGDRMGAAVVYDGVIYASIYQSETKSYWVCSIDAGKSWREFGELPTGGYTDGFHSFLVVEDRIWAVTHVNADLYYMDIDTATGTVSGTRNDTGARTNLAYMDNVFRGYFIQGDPVVVLDSTGEFDNKTFPHTFAATRAEDEDAFRISVTGAGSDDTHWLNGLKVNFLDGYSGTNRTHGIFTRNNTTSGQPSGLRAEAVGDHAGFNRGIFTRADNDDGSGTSFGIWAEVLDGAADKAAGIFVDTGPAVDIEVRLCEDGDKAARFLGAPIVITPTAAQSITGAGVAIISNASVIVINPDGDYTLTVNPSVTNGVMAGQLLYITCANAEANTITLNNHSDVASGVHLGAATRAISGTDCLALLYDGTDWIEVSFSNN
jgi:hypothetical protein